MGMAAAAVPEMGEPINVATSLLPSMDGQTLLWSPHNQVAGLLALGKKPLISGVFDFNLGFYHVTISSKIIFDF